jgi:hypothetical protein
VQLRFTRQVTKEHYTVSVVDTDGDELLDRAHLQAIDVQSAWEQAIIIAFRACRGSGALRPLLGCASARKTDMNQIAKRRSGMALKPLTLLFLVSFSPLSLAANLRDVLSGRPDARPFSTYGRRAFTHSAQPPSETKSHSPGARNLIRPPQRKNPPPTLTENGTLLGTISGRHEMRL